MVVYLNSVSFGFLHLGIEKLDQILQSSFSRVNHHLPENMMRPNSSFFLISDLYSQVFSVFNHHKTTHESRVRVYERISEEKNNTSKKRDKKAPYSLGVQRREQAKCGVGALR